MKSLFPYSLLRSCLVGVLSLALIFAPFPSTSRNQALAFEPLSATLVVGGVTLTVAQFMLISSVVATTAALICQGVSKDEAIARGMEALARENQALLHAAQVEFRKLFSLDEHRLSFQETCNAITDLRFQSASLGFEHEGLTPLAPSPEISAALEFQYSHANSVLQERIFDAFAMEGLNLRNINIHDEVSFQNAFYEMEYLMENEIFVAKLQKIFEETEALWLSEASVSTRAFLMSREGSEIASATSQKMAKLMRCLRDPEFRMSVIHWAAYPSYAIFLTNWLILETAFAPPPPGHRDPSPVPKLDVINVFLYLQIAYAVIATPVGSEVRRACLAGENEWKQWKRHGRYENRHFERQFVHLAFWASALGNLGVFVQSAWTRLRRTPLAHPEEK